MNTQKALNVHKTDMAKLIKSELHTNLDNIMVEGNLEEYRQVGDITVRSFILKPEEGINITWNHVGARNEKFKSGCHPVY